MNKLTLILLSALALCTVSLSPQAKKQAAQASIEQSSYGYLPNGELVTQYVLTNNQGMEATVITYGGIITALKVPDKKGKLADVVLGYDKLDDYVNDTRFFGALIGRYGNRIAKGQFTLDGKKYQLPTNNGPNHLHGGFKGFDKRNWQATAFKKDGNVGLDLSLFSADGDQGYPGNLSVHVKYTLTNDNQFLIDYSAITDKPTIVNLTQHSYFNLAGKGTILDQELMINAEQITPVDKGLIPTGKIESVKGTPFDFTSLTPIGKNIDAKNKQLEYGGGYDHNFILKDSKSDGLKLAAKLVDPKSGRVMELLTTEPAVQFYAGNFLDGSDRGKGRNFEFRSGLCLEPQHSPDSPNQDHFPSTVLRPGEVYKTSMVYKFSTTSN